MNDKAVIARIAFDWSVKDWFFFATIFLLLSDGGDVENVKHPIFLFIRINVQKKYW